MSTYSLQPKFFSQTSRHHKYAVIKIKFGWDELKATANLKKNQVSFEGAKTIFFDEFGVQFFDEDH